MKADPTPSGQAAPALAELLQVVTAQGLTVVTRPGWGLLVLDAAGMRKAKRRARNQRHRERKKEQKRTGVSAPPPTSKASQNVSKETIQDGSAVLRAARDGEKVSFYRGLCWRDMCGRGETGQRLNFQSLKAGTYPPKLWCVPKDLRGVELLRVLEERRVLARKPEGGRLCKEAEERRVKRPKDGIGRKKDAKNGGGRTD